MIETPATVALTLEDVREAIFEYLQKRHYDRYSGGPLDKDIQINGIKANFGVVARVQRMTIPQGIPSLPYSEPVR